MNTMNTIMICERCGHGTPYRHGFGPNATAARDPNTPFKIHRTASSWKAVLDAEPWPHYVDVSPFPGAPSYRGFASKGEIHLLSMADGL